MKFLFFWYLAIYFLCGSHYCNGRTSPGQLMDMFTQIYEATGTFPDERDEYTQLSIVNRHFNACLAVLGRKVGNGGRVGLENCYFTTIDSPELFWLKHMGNGYVTLSTPWNKCIGSGVQEGSAVWTGDWCDSSSHQFSMLVRDDSMLLVNSESNNFLTGVAEKQQVRSYQYRPEDPKQLWSICSPSGKRCWPSTTPLPSTTTTTTLLPFTSHPVEEVRETPETAITEEYRGEVPV